MSLAHPMRKKSNTCAGPKNNFSGIDDDVHPFAYGVSLIHAMEMRKACDDFFRRRGLPFGNNHLAYGSKTEDKPKTEEAKEVAHV